MRQRRMSIRWKIFFCILVFMALPVILIAFISNTITVESLVEQKRTEDLDTIQQLQNGTENFLRSIESYARLIARDGEVQKFFTEKVSAAKNQQAYRSLSHAECTGQFARMLPEVAAVSLLDPRGSIIGERELEPDRLDWYFSYFQQDMDGTGLLWTKPYLIQKRGEKEARLALSVLCPVTGEEGECLGYAALHVPVEELDQMLSYVSNQIYLLDGESYVISRKDNDGRYDSFYRTSNISYGLLMEDASQVADQNGRRVVVTTQDFGRFGWRFVLVSPFDEIDLQNHERLLRLLYLVAGCILFSMLAAFFISNIITRPIVKLKDTMLRVMQSDLSARQKQSSNDEIGQMTDTFNSMLDTIEDLLHQVYEQQAGKRRLQLQLIQAQVKPHFLYNVLEMILCFVRDGMREEAESAITSLALFYRVSLSDGSDIIRVRQEVSLIENYLKLQRLRYIEFMDFTLSVHPSLNECSIPKLTLQPVVENAIYHGLKGKCEKGMLCVTGYLQDGRVTFEIYDNGAGMTGEQLERLRESVKNQEQAGDFGLGSVVKRLNLYFDGKAAVQIDSAEGEFTNVVLSFPAVDK